jgi:uncharacterized protein YggE
MVLAIVSIVGVSAQKLDSPYVSVNGYAVMEVEPNEITISITIDEKDSKGKISLKQQEQTMVSRLQKLGIDTEKSLFVEGFSSSSYRRNDGTLYKNYALIVDSHDLVNKVFEDLQRFGINKLVVTKRSRNDIAALRSELRVAAVKNAKEKAMELAGALGLEVGVAIQIEDYSNDSDPIMFRGVTLGYQANYRKDSDVEDYVAPEFQKIKLDYRVRVVFVLK